jgi:aminopeptidase N
MAKLRLAAPSHSSFGGDRNMEGCGIVRTRWLTIMLVVGLVVSGPVAVADAGRQNGEEGSSGLGDRFFPLAGNGGYDVDHYDLDLSWDPATGVLAGKVVIEAHALQTLERFDLDLRGFDVSRVTVNGRRARFARDGQELIISPARDIERDQEMKIVVRYSGVPQTVIDPDGALDGWIPTHDGAIALSEPQGSPSWFPVNDYPTDKATLSMSMTVPSSRTVLGNGLPDKPQHHGTQTTYTWRERRPMASYLATVAIGNYDVTTTSTSSGIPVIVGVDPQLAASSQPSLDRIGEMLDWEIAQFGRYPFESVGAIVVDAPDVGYALETQTRPVFTAAVDDSTLVHELAHQWFGDSVALASWPEMWLNEGFATYVEWMWSEREGGPTPQQLADEAYASKDAADPFWTVAPGPDTLPDPSQLFSEPVYLRGAMTLQALRTEIGDDVFFRVLRRWAQTNRDGNVSTAEFVAFAETASGRDLSGLFQEWLSTPVKPAASPSGQPATALTATALRTAAATGTTRR